jgi:ParB family chromosome partitioning protein
VLRGARLMAAKRIVQARQQHGKGQASSDQGSRRHLSVEGLLKAYQNDVEKKQTLLRKANATRNEMMFVIHALKELLVDENFITLLRAERLASIPKSIANRLANRSVEI